MIQRSSLELTPQQPTNPAQGGSTPSAERAQHSTAATPPTTPSTEEGYERLVFTDPVAFKCLEEDPSTVLVQSRCALVGYEIYIVEQWACSRVHPTFVINTYTGNPSHTVVAGVLRIPKNEDLWSPRLRVYFNTIAQCHAKRRETPLGTLMVTSLSDFPSSLTVIDVPEGDVRKYREDFVVNVNLKRLGCSGRAGLNLSRPTPATEAKFYQLYRTSERIPLFTAVVGLVKLCQLALNVFDKLASEYVDGLLCDVTERAISDWWADIGTELYNIEPTDGVLGPTTVSALLGTLMGARNRLHAWGAPIGKDPFDLENLKRGIGNFQKTQKLEKTRRLDRQTLEKLHRATAKAASGEGWAVPRAVKSTMAELGGKGGEMVMGIVGGRDKAGISDIETLDITRFVQLVSGERAKWLWHGKPRKTHTDPFRHDAVDEDSALPRDTWGSKRKETGSGLTSGRPSLETEQSWKLTETPTARDVKEQQVKQTIKKSVSVKVSDAKAGLGRFRDAVVPGLRSNYHHHKQSKEIEVDIDFPSQKVGDPRSGRASSKEKPDHLKHTGPDEAIPSDIYMGLKTSEPLSNPLSKISISESEAVPADFVKQTSRSSDKIQEQASSDERNIESQASPFVSDKPHNMVDRTEEQVVVTRLLPRPLSFSLIPKKEASSYTRFRTRRHMSFSIIEESVLCWKSVAEIEPADLKADPALEDCLLYEDLMTENERSLTTKIVSLDMSTSVWVEEQVTAVENLENVVQSRQKELDSIYQDKHAEHRALQATTADLIAKESQSLLEHSKKLETLGAKLDYEVNSLQSKVDEVEIGLVDYEHHIKALETRIRTLINDENRLGNSWLEWGRRLFTRGG